MATTVPAMKARLGNTDYYILSMKAQELADKVKIPKELEGWEDESIEERYQRDLNYHRVKAQIAPYLANDESRFFGAVIIAAINFGESVLFEPLSEVTTKGLPGLYRTVAANMGFLTFSGGEVLVPLDGQHRLKAIQFAVTGKDEKGVGISNITTPCTDLAQEDVTVILVAYDTAKSRKIFTRVNKYAKPTTTGQNIVTDDDDIVAVLTRKLANDLIGGRLAKFTSNTLRPKDPEFTTLAIIYNCNEEIIAKTFPTGKLGKTQLPDIGKQQLYQSKVTEVWEAVLEGIEVFADAIEDKDGSGDDRRREIRRENLLGKPVVQECVIKAFLRLTGAPTNIGTQVACERLSGLPWSISEKNLKVWQRILWTGGMDGKIITKNRKLATEMISYLAGESISGKARDKLLAEYRKLFPEGERSDLRLPKLK